ncbi:MAG: ribonuclease P protein component [Pseudomonadota bacterium]|nr:ribonuclease P protein component [Pseudomonadota bacterium]
MRVAHAVAAVSPFDVSTGRRWSKLSTPSEFDAVFQGRCASHGDFARVLAKASSHPVPRLGITVSRKVCKTAVGRNYMKRVSRELFRLHCPQLQGLDVVVLMRRMFGTQDFQRFREEFAKHVQRVQKCRNACVSSSVPTSTC